MVLEDTPCHLMPKALPISMSLTLEDSLVDSHAFKFTTVETRESRSLDPPICVMHKLQIVQLGLHTSVC